MKCRASGLLKKELSFDPGSLKPPQPGGKVRELLIDLRYVMIIFAQNSSQ